MTWMTLTWNCKAKTSLFPISIFKMKQKLFRQQAGSGTTFTFLLSSQFCRKNRTLIHIVMSGSWRLLIHSFNHHFQDFEQCKQQMQVFANPFAVSISEVSPDYQLELIDLQSFDALRAVFRNKTLTDFTSLFQRHLWIWRTMLLFTQACLEETFSQMKLNKSKTQNQLSDNHLEDVLHLSTTNIPLEIS